MAAFLFYTKRGDTMTDKQKRFCDEYIIDCNATQAAIRAGYAKATARKASDWINETAQEKPTSDYNPEMRACIDRKLAEIESEKTADAKEVMEYLTAVMRGEHTEQVLRLVGEGVQEVDSISVAEKDRLKAAELIGKRYGLFKENVDLNGVDTTLNIKIDYGEGESNGHKNSG